MPSHSDSPATSSTSRKAGTLSHNRRHQRSSSFPFIKSLNPFKRKPSPPPPCPNKGFVEPYEVAPGIWSTDATAKVFGVDKEDELIIRGANPRTGVVTPWEGSQASGEGGSWLSGGRGDLLGRGKSRESSGKWTQEEHGWSLVQEPGPSPGQQADGGKPPHDMSEKDLDNRFVVNMPGVDNPDPPSVTAEQIRFFQEGVERACNKAGVNHGPVDPETLPSPRAETPEGPSTPPSKLQKIRRKEVRSAMVERNNSTDTVVINREATVATAIPPTFSNGTSATPSFNVIPPSSSASPASKRPERGHRALSPKQIHSQRPFLGPLPDEEKSLIVNVTPSPCLPSTAPKPSPLRPVESDPQEATFAPQQLFRTLSQYLPPLSFLHPSYFANLPQSDRNPRSRVPESQQKPHRGQNASTITTSITTPITTTTTGKTQRWRVGRQDGTDSVPRANLRAFEGQKKWWDQQQQHQQRQMKKGVIKPEIKKSHQDQDMNRFSAAHGAQEVEAEPPPANQNREKGEMYNGWVVPDASADDAKAPISDENVGERWKGRKSTSKCICMKCRIRRSRGSKPTQTPEGKLESQSGNTIAEHFPKNKGRNGVGCIRTDDRPGDATVCGGNGGRSSGLRMRGRANERRRRVEELEASEELQLELPLDGEAIVGGHAWFACLHDGVEERDDQGGQGDDDGEGEERLEAALATTMVAVWNAVCTMEKTFHVSGTAKRVYTRVIGMVQHVLITLSPASAALKMLRRRDARVEDYLRAVRDLALAGVYLLILLHILMTVVKAVRVSMKVLLCAWWPVKAALVVVRWFALG